MYYTLQKDMHAILIITYYIYKKNKDARSPVNDVTDVNSNIWFPTVILPITGGNFKYI
jgi:hypothetical protein